MKTEHLDPDALIATEKPVIHIALVGVLFQMTLEHAIPVVTLKSM